MTDRRTYSALGLEDAEEEPLRPIGGPKRGVDATHIIAGCCCCCVLFVWIGLSIAQIVVSWKYGSCQGANIFEKDAEKYVIPPLHTILTPRHQTNFWGDMSTVYAGEDNKTKLGYWREVKVLRTQYAYVLPGIEVPFIIAWQPWWNMFFGKRFYVKHCMGDLMFPEYYLKQQSTWGRSNYVDEWHIEQGDKLVAVSKHVMFSGWDKTSSAWFSTHLVREWGVKVFDPEGAVIGVMAQDVSEMYSSWFTNEYVSSWKVHNLNTVQLPTDVLSFLAALYDLDGLSYDESI